MSCISENSYLTLCALLSDQIALSLPADKVYLAEARLQNLASQHTRGDINALIEKASTVAEDALRIELVEAMAINETYFFRDPILSESFLETMIPTLLDKRRADKTLRIWSAACSTGQEIYSVAMLLDQHFPQLRNWQVTLIASDFSQSALSKAKQGCYGLNEMNRGLPARNMALYFEQQGLDWQIKTEIRERICFEKINLIREWPEELPLFDIVLLRNVLLYFPWTIACEYFAGYANRQSVTATCSSAPPRAWKNPPASFRPFPAAIVLFTNLFEGAPMEMSSQPAMLSQKIARIGANVLSDFLNIPVRAQSGPPPTVQHGAEVAISGKWKGSVTVCTCDALGPRIAARMFRKEDDAVTGEDIIDALTELTNIIAGNIKAILPGPSQLSLPVPLAVLPGEHRNNVDVTLFDDRQGMLRISLQPAEH